MHALYIIYSKSSIRRVSLSSGQQTMDSSGRTRETVRVGKKGASLFSSRYVYGGKHVYSINRREENGTTVKPINPAVIRCRPSPRVLRNTSRTA